MRIEADRELVAPPKDVWALVAEPYRLPEWWPGYVGIRPIRRGPANDGARWTVVRSSDAGFVRKPGSEGVIAIRLVERGPSLAWRDLEQGFSAEVQVQPSGTLTRAYLRVEAPWWRVQLEGLRSLPRQALARLHDVCQTAASR